MPPKTKQAVAKQQPYLDFPRLAFAPPADNEPAHRRGIVKVSRAPDGPFDKERPNTEKLEYAVRQWNSNGQECWFSVPYDGLNDKELQLLDEDDFGIPPGKNWLHGRSLLAIMKKHKVEFSAKQRQALQGCQVDSCCFTKEDFGWAKQFRQTGKRTEEVQRLQGLYDKLLNDLGFSDPEYNTTVRDTLESKVRNGLKNNKDRLQREHAYYKRPNSITTGPGSVSWAEWVHFIPPIPEKEASAEDKAVYEERVCERIDNASYYSAELTIRAAAHTFTLERIAKLQGYLELAKKGIDIQDHVDAEAKKGSKKDDDKPVNPDVEMGEAASGSESTRTNSKSTPTRNARDRSRERERSPGRWHKSREYRDRDDNRGNTPK